MSAIGTGSSSNLEHEANETRSKRRRTESPEHSFQYGAGDGPTSWYQQLTAAANDVTAASHSISETRTVTTDKRVQASDAGPEGEGTMQGLSKPTERGPRLHKSIDTSITAAVPGSKPAQGNGKPPWSSKKVLSTGEISPTKSIHSRSGEQEGAPATPPKRVSSTRHNSPSHPEKMLKLRSDGRLLSPKSPKRAAGPDSRRKIKTTKSAVSQKSRIAVIKYGVDKDSRSAIAQKIQAIIEGHRTAPQTKEALRTSPQKPAQPPKPTHPFFLGKSARTTQVDFPTPHDAVENQAITEKRKNNILSISSPCKAGLLNRNSGKTWADAAGSFQKAPRLPGALEATWPPDGMVHVRPLTDYVDAPTELLGDFMLPFHERKLKDAPIRITESESVLRPCRIINKNLRDADTIGSVAVRKPTRTVMTGLELQRRVLENIKCNPAGLDPVFDPLQDELCNSQPQLVPGLPAVHSGVLRMYQSIPCSMSAFNKFECENIDWAHKYAPKRAEDVLQQGPEVFILRDWLESLTISAVENINGSKRIRDSSVASMASGVKKKRRRRAEALDGFVVSSDEEGDQMNEIPTFRRSGSAGGGESSLKRSVIRGGDLSQMPGVQDRSNNAVVISGPHGCGKTAAIYAVAQELGFEIFEINAGSRRSGKDILDKVGDMTRNHLVNHSAEADSKGTVGDGEDLLHLTNSLKQDIASGRQGTMQSFFQPKAATKTKPRGRPRKKDDAPKAKASPEKASLGKASPKKASLKNLKIQKQSVILLEEVDVLFEEDKQFWATTLEMIMRSKRPVIMTCTEESLLPLENLPLFAILRFTPPPESLAVDYLLLLACNEGHLLSRDAVATLYGVKRNDLRASMTELDFYCQMAIGDTQGGLGWFLIGPAPQVGQIQKGEALRVVSEDTYPKDIGLLPAGHHLYPAENALEHEKEVLLGLWHGLGLDMVDSDNFVGFEPIREAAILSKERNLAHLQAFDNAYEALSVTDICSPLGLRSGNSIVLDTSQPKLLEKSRASFAEGAILLQADPLVDQTGTSANIALTLRLLARRQLPFQQCLHPGPMADALPASLIALQKSPPVTPEILHEAFTPFKGPIISTFSRPISTLTTEVAPFIRSITAFDLRLEDQRRQLEALRSDPRDGANGKRTRTTRASRAALEGGAKATTRRERWFPNTLDFGLVSRTGGESWMEAALRRVDIETEDGYGTGDLKGEERAGSDGGH